MAGDDLGDGGRLAEPERVGGMDAELVAAGRQQVGSGVGRAGDRALVNTHPAWTSHLAPLHDVLKDRGAAVP